MNSELAEKTLRAFDDADAHHPGFRPAHAKGILLTGVFRPSPDARSLTRAPHIQRESTPVTVRFSDFGGVPSIGDNDPNSSPRGIAVRFHLAEHIHTDIIGHSVDGFPVRTAEEFIEFLHAVAASGPDAPHPNAVEAFLASHPAALAFVQTLKPIPASFAKESYFAVSAYKFTNDAAVARFGRYRIRPENSSEYLNAVSAAERTPNFLFEEIGARLKGGRIRMRIAVQLAADGDVTNDSTAPWPADRPEVAFGTLELSAEVPNNEAEQRHIIFDPIPRVPGIEASEDPLLEARAEIYLASGRRRRAEAPATRAGR